MSSTDFTSEERQEFLHLIEELRGLRQAMLEAEERGLTRMAALPTEQRASARNLLHYLALRQRDLRSLQQRLARLGLSSLGRSEAHTLGNLNTVLRLLGILAHHPVDLSLGDLPLSMEEGRRLLAQHTEKLLGPDRAERSVRIMVTMPGEAADRPELVEQLLVAGMDLMRINTAHDNPTAWRRMIEHLRTAEQKVARTCRVLMDLAGPKLRTGSMEPGPQVVRIKPRRNVLGQEVEPARVWLHPLEHSGHVPQRGAIPVPVEASWLATLAVGNRVFFRDSRNRLRFWQVVQVESPGVLVEGHRTTYLTPGIVLHRRSRGQPDSTTTVGPLPALEQAILLSRGDLLRLTRELIPGQDAQRDAQGNVIRPAHISCTLQEVFDAARPGEPASLDDGKFLGVIEAVSSEAVDIRIQRVRGGTAKLRADKGINLPQTELQIPALTARDQSYLPFVAQHADLVGYSFVRTPEDVVELQRTLDACNASQIGIVLKIETVTGFRHLPALLLSAMTTGFVGVMIARGDLAVEAGFERLAEVQEEILWICEAAHMPVIWATQVLETLAREGMPSRAEITDAAMGTRAECVMLNKGPFIVEAVTALDDILRRMMAHQNKKRSMLRRLSIPNPLDTGLLNKDEEE